MNKISKKKLSKLGGKMPFSTITAPKKKIRKKPRSRKETLRIYGPPGRLEFVKSLPCAACGVVGYSVNAHLLGNAGLSRKGHYKTIGPLCGIRFGTPTIIGCHITYDRYRSVFDAAYPHFDPEKVARETESRWSAYIGRDTLKEETK